MKESLTFIMKLEEAIRGETEAILYYTKLLDRATREEDREAIQRIRADEEKHLQNFKMLYRHLTGKEPHPYRPQVDLPETYYEALKEAALDELEANELYRQMYLSTNNPFIRDIMLEAFTDEAEHAQRLTLLYIDALQPVNISYD